MNELEARTYRAAYEAAVKRYSKMTKAQLRTEYAAALEAAGRRRVFGGPISKDELITDILNLRGYTPAKLNEATHVIGHQPGERWSACEWCQCQETWLADGAPMLPGRQVIRQCVLDPGHRGFCRDDQGRERDRCDDPPEYDPGAEAGRIAEDFDQAAADYATIEQEQQ